MTGYDSENIFAKLLRGEIPAARVYEDEETLAFMDIMRARTGHLLVIPKTPCRNLLDASPAQLAAVMQTVQKLSQAVIKAFGADGCRCSSSRGGGRAGSVPPAFPRAAAPRRRPDAAAGADGRSGTDPGAGGGGPRRAAGRVSTGLPEHPGTGGGGEGLCPSRAPRAHPRIFAARGSEASGHWAAFLCRRAGRWQRPGSRPRCASELNVEF